MGYRVEFDPGVLFHLHRFRENVSFCVQNLILHRQMVEAEIFPEGVPMLSVASSCGFGDVGFRRGGAGRTLGADICPVRLDLGIDMGAFDNIFPADLEDAASCCKLAREMVKFTKGGEFAMSITGSCLGYTYASEINNWLPRATRATLSIGQRPARLRHRADVVSMAWRATRRFSPRRPHELDSRAGST